MEAEFPLLRQGVELICNMQSGEAEQILSAFYDTNPAFAFHYAEVAFYKALATESSTDAKVAFERLERANKIASQMKKGAKKPENALEIEIITRIMQANCALLDATLKFRLQMQVKGLYNFRKSWKYFESAQTFYNKLSKTHVLYNELTSYYKCGLGFFHFIVSVIPKEFQWIAEGIGFEGNREVGLAELHEAVDAKGAGSYLAVFHLVWIYSFFNEDLAAGEKWLTYACSLYPNSGYFDFLGGYMYRKMGDLEKSTQIFTKGKVAAIEVPQFQAYCDYELGYDAYLNLDWNKAISYLKPFLSTSSPESFRCYGFYQLAMCLEHTGRTSEALDEMKKVLPLVRKNYDYDEFSERKAKRYIANKGVSPFERKYHLALIHEEVRRWSSCYTTAFELTALAKDEEEKARARYVLGHAALNLEQYAEAKEVLLEVLKSEKILQKDNLTIIPHALTDLAEVSLFEKQWETAEKHLKLAKTYTAYDFSQLLGWRIKKDLDRVAKKM